MYIMKRPSAGRGEYEVAGAHGQLPASDLVEHDLLIQAGPFGIRETGVFVSGQGGKLRLRLRTRGTIHLARQVEALLLLPQGTRDESTLVGGLPVLRKGGYVLRRMNCSSVTQDRANREAVLMFDELTIVNDREGRGSQDVPVPERLLRVEQVHRAASMFADPIDRLLIAHRAAAANTGAVPASLETTVQDLMEAVEELAPDYGVPYVAGTDVLPVLEQILALPPVDVPEDVDLSTQDDIDIRIREVKKYRQLAAARGSAAIRFSREVREAYRSTCVMCGLRLPKSNYNIRPGVDSAHILPWSRYDLDVVSNGVCLCKNHHWAFDEAFLSIRYDAQIGAYLVSATQRARNALADDAMSLAELERVEGPIPRDRLPGDERDWPNPEYLRRLIDELGIEGS